MQRTALCLIALAAAGLPAGPGFAHHSLTMFDFSRTVTVQGVVRSFDWANPHTSIVLVGSGREGQTETWFIEGQSPSYLARHGWTRRTIAPGDKITIQIYPLKAGGTAGHFHSLLLPNGQTLLQQPLN